MTLSDYTELNEQIHAPKELKAKVLAAAVQNENNKRKKTKGLYSRGWSTLQKAAVAAILLICLPVTAYAAVKGFGLLDYLSRRGMKDIESVEELVISPSELYGDAEQDSEKNTEDGAIYYSTSFAKYTIQEAVCDSQTIYLSAKVKPNGEYFLIPQYLTSEDPVEYLLGMEQLFEKNPEQTIGQYASSLGKTVAYAGVGYRITVNGEEQPLTGGEDFSYDAEGNLYFYYIAQNFSDSKVFTMKCTGNGYAPDASFEEIERVSFEITVADKSADLATVAFTDIDPKAKEETGIQVSSITIQETNMGLYVTFCYSAEEAGFTDIFFKLVDANGEELPSLPGSSGLGCVDNGDGSYSCVVNYQRPDSMDGMQFVIRDFANAINYGPYRFE